jgi:hypothetical protein
VGNTEDADTIADELEATGLGVGQPTEEDGENIGKHLERLRHSIGLDSTHAEGTGSLLSTSRWCTPAVATFRQWSIDKVADKLLNSIVRGSLSELDGTDQVGDSGHRTWDTTQGLEFLCGRLALIVTLQQCNVVSSIWVLGRFLVARVVTLW